MAGLYWICFFVYFALQGSDGDKITMRLVEEPSNFGYNQETQLGSSGLEAHFKAANISGPPMLRRLEGKCFDLINEQYKFVLCPFHNVTQHEQSLRWNPYSGILGVWQEWQIENNTFQGMFYKSGDVCANKRRQVLVNLLCSQKTELLTVEEPVTCEYVMNFSTPLVCHDHVMLVYPTLSDDLQLKWDELEGELVREEITRKGYKKRLHKIFEEADLVLSPDKSLVALHPEKKTEEVEDFDNLYSCNIVSKMLTN
ncbi:N-acetylglucosamine-1-phosphotransferase subunit gamma-like [Saccoglossus kowalevskii]|uniref:N-acetylglucosamine-1-phosphotransferase subunit gamma-like n=1 Tax=Saccoglossus kowalevskii TaxID=10224 RepID=A0ABM0GWV5_SACKO|nr:PREDICTED: N-acetylglucosamine-1-phosphotransferase subunit gamma-like [Saccoglossus kowalevskii]